MSHGSGIGKNVTIVGTAMNVLGQGLNDSTLTAKPEYSISSSEQGTLFKSALQWT